MLNEKSKTLNLMSDLSDVLENGEIITQTNPSLESDVRIKRGGLREGLVHLIDHRIRERVMNNETQMDIEQAKRETAAVLFLVIDNIEKAPAEKESNGHYAIYNVGIKTVIGKDKKGRYVVTGYDNNKTKEEATESINAVIAQYGNTPEFLGIYAQVGAVIASYNILPKQDKMSSENAHNHSLLYKQATLIVNGKKRVCRSGLLEGFKNCVKRLDTAEKLNQELINENKKLKEIINRSNDNEISF